MTDRQLLETILNKMDTFEKKQDTFEKKMDNFEKKQDNFEKKQDNFEKKQDNFEKKQNVFEIKQDTFEKKQNVFEIKQDTFEKKQYIFEKKQNESSEILSALRHASEVQKAQYDELKFEVAKLSGEIKKGIEEITEMQKSILEMYGSHEAEIRLLKKKVGMNSKFGGLG